MNRDKDKIITNILDNKLGLSSEEKGWLAKYIKPPQYPITVDVLNSKMSEKFGDKNRKRDIKHYLKHDANYSYKKGSSMLYAGATRQNILLQSIYSSCMIGDISKWNYLVNIDEASF